MGGCTDDDCGAEVVKGGEGGCGVGIVGVWGGRVNRICFNSGVCETDLFCIVSIGFWGVGGTGIFDWAKLMRATSTGCFDKDCEGVEAYGFACDVGGVCDGALVEGERFVFWVISIGCAPVGFGVKKVSINGFDGVGAIFDTVSVGDEA